MSAIEKYYAEYRNSLEGFEKFHNEVINMPHDQFSDAGLKKVKKLAGYILLTENKLEKDGASYKDIMLCIRNEIRHGNYPKNRDQELEDKYFVFNHIDIQYEKEGRMFRHLMSMCAFFGFAKSLSKQKKIFNYDKCREYYLSDDSILMPIARNNIMMLNARDNGFVKSLNGITIDENTDYRPTYGILRYMKEIGRPATKFELSVLLGRIDDCKQEKDIIARALEIGREFSPVENEQIGFLFREMQWRGTR